MSMTQKGDTYLLEAKTKFYKNGSCAYPWLTETEEGELLTGLATSFLHNHHHHLCYNYSDNRRRVFLLNNQHFTSAKDGDRLGLRAGPGSGGSVGRFICSG